jgi:hypothetical protein
VSKLKGPLFSIAAAGNLGSAVNFTSRNGLALARRAPRASRSATPAQLARRLIYSDACAAWQLLTGGERATWSAAGDAARPRLTGFNLFMRDQLGTIPPGTLWDAGATTWDAGATTWD